MDRPLSIGSSMILPDLCEESMRDPKEQQELEQRAARLNTDIQGLVDVTGEAKLLEPVTQLRETVRGQLVKRLTKVRAGGYAFAADLDRLCDELSSRIDSVESEFSSLLDMRTDDWSWRLRKLRDEVRDIERDHGVDQSVRLRHAEEDLAAVKKEADQLRAQVKASLDDLPERVGKVNHRLALVETSLRHAAGSTAPLQPGEALYLAAEAEWKKGPSARENPDGVLLVTDRRIIMERKEKEGGFLGFGGQKVQELAWELPIAQVQSVRPEQRGLLGGVDLLHFTLTPDSPMSPGPITVEVKGGHDADAFAALVRKALDGSLEGERLAAE